LGQALSHYEITRERRRLSQQHSSDLAIGQLAHH
jgi:hypothetical protein